jgi:lipopolysaccharide transport system ATP-binding protein
MICGTLHPTGGSIHTNGRIAALLELGSGFNPEFTGRENIYMNSAVLGLSKEEVDVRFDDIAAFADIGDFIEQPVKTYSSGMVVRLAFAVSVCVEPDILVIDEALAVGDAAFQFKCMERMERLIESGTTVLFVSHDMGIVKSFCDHVIYLEHGQEKMSGQPDGVAEQYFLDIRDEQRRQTGGGRVISKPFLGKGKGSAFGTEEGHIISASFTNSMGLFSTFMYGEDVEIEVEAKYLESLLYPHLALLVHDRRMVTLGGSFFPLAGDSNNEGWKEAKVLVQFPINLAAGRYFITVRLETRSSRTNFSPIDKQVGALSLQVLENNGALLGAVDFSMHFLSS